MAITNQAHSICLDCSENSFTITGTYTGTAGGDITSTLYVTDPDGNVSEYNADTLYNSGTSGGTQTITAGTTSISTSNALTSVTLDWGTVANNTTYSFTFRTMVNGYVQDYVISYTSDSSATDGEVGSALDSLLTAIAVIVNIEPPAYVGGTSLTITANAGASFGIGSLNNLSSTATTPNTTTTTASFADGVWLVKWVMLDDAATDPSPSITNSIFLCNVEKCVREKASKVDVGCGCCGSRESDEAMDAIMYLEGIKSALSCGKVEKAKTILSGLQDICNNDCKNC